MQTEQQTQERRIVNQPKNFQERERRLEIQRRKQQNWRRHQKTAEQREHHSMNFKSYTTLRANGSGFG